MTYEFICEEGRNWEVNSGSIEALKSNIVGVFTEEKVYYIIQHNGKTLLMINGEPPELLFDEVGGSNILKRLGLDNYPLDKAVTKEL